MLFLKWAKWFVNNSISLLAIPFTVLAIIVSLHTDLFKDTSKDKKVSEYFKIGTFYDLFDKQKKIESKNIPIKEIEVESDVNRYTHIIYIDRTYSTKDFKEDAYSNFKQNIRDSILSGGRYANHINISDSDSLKNIFLHIFYKNYTKKEIG